jgi:hypothetical protein
MAELLSKIDNYLDIQDKKERIEESLHVSSDIKEVIELVKKSENKEETLKLLNRNVREQIKKLIDGGLL